MSTMVLDPEDFARIAHAATLSRYTNQESVMNAVVRLSEANARAYNVRYWHHEDVRNDPAIGYTREELEDAFYDIRGTQVSIADCLKSLRSLVYNLDDQRKEVESEYGTVESGIMWALIERMEASGQTW